MSDTDHACAPLRGVSASEEARAWLRRLRERHGPLIFHQSHGCCDGSAPLLMVEGEFRLGSRDELLARVEGVPVYIHGAVRDQWADQELILTVSHGAGGGFSLEVPEGIRFQLVQGGCVVPGSSRARSSGRFPAA